MSRKPKPSLLVYHLDKVKINYFFEQVEIAKSLYQQFRI